MKRAFHLAVVVGLLCSPLTRAPLASAQSNNQDEVCPDPALELDPYRYLRAVSLDLRGTAPALEEYDALDGAEDPMAVIEAKIDEWMESEAFVERVVRRHRDLLWPNVTNVNLLSANAGLRRDRLDDGTMLYWRSNLAMRYRGDRIQCLDEPATFDADGNVVAEDQGGGVQREGWVLVRPYWAPDTEVKVCAFDAQEAVSSPSGTDCSSLAGYNDPACGCGPALAWCLFGRSMDPILEAMGTDIELRVRDMLDSGDYLDLFTGRLGYVNGPLVHYWRWMTGVPGGTRTTPEPLDLDRLPDLDYVDVDTWLPLPLGAEHAGVLTAPGFLLRFQTDRARANRFYNAFLCQPFQPPSSGIPAADDQVPSQDLQVRDGCKYCHAVLEPSGSYWGRWTESGAGFLAAQDFPPLRDDCERCALFGVGCSDECRRYYKTNALAAEEEPYLGWLNAYLFRLPEHHDFVEQGPRLLALNAVVDGRLPRCAVRNASTWLLGRDTLAEEAPWVEEVTGTFVGAGFDYKALTKAVLTSEAYRSVR
jgi:hypothetical protein